MEEGMAGVIQECFAKNCDEAAVGDPPLFCEKHEKMIPEKAILWLRENHFDLYKKPSRKWIAIMSRAVAKIMMEENTQNLTTVITRMAQAMERDKNGKE